MSVFTFLSGLILMGVIWKACARADEGKPMKVCDFCGWAQGIVKNTELAVALLRLQGGQMSDLKIGLDKAAAAVTSLSHVVSELGEKVASLNGKVEALLAVVAKSGNAELIAEAEAITADAIAATATTQGIEAAVDAEAGKVEAALAGEETVNTTPAEAPVAPTEG